MTIRIPFNKPCIVGQELFYVGQAVAGGHASGDGPFTRRAQQPCRTASARTACCSPPPARRPSKWLLAFASLGRMTR